MALALLANTAATVAVLAVLIVVFGPISGAHFNPAVTLVMVLQRRLPKVDAVGYVLAQILGCCAGACLAHAMFEMPLLQIATRARTGTAQWLAEGVATFGLIVVVLGNRRPRDAGWMVAAWIGAAYWFTASTSFANPAITVARSLTNTFSGIRPADVLDFIAAQLAGALIALLCYRLLFVARGEQSSRATR
jgi:glycerol uptake facilitator-like aquaporin